jgi:hypothetical protein
MKKIFLLFLCSSVASNVNGAFRAKNFGGAKQMPNQTPEEMEQQRVLREIEKNIARTVADMNFNPLQPKNPQVWDHLSKFYPDLQRWGGTSATFADRLDDCINQALGGVGLSNNPGDLTVDQSPKFAPRAVRSTQLTLPQLRALKSLEQEIEHNLLKIKILIGHSASEEDKCLSNLITQSLVPEGLPAVSNHNEFQAIEAHSPAFYAELERLITYLQIRLTMARALDRKGAELEQEAQDWLRSKDRLEIKDKLKQVITEGIRLKKFNSDRSDHNQILWVLRQWLDRDRAHPDVISDIDLIEYIPWCAQHPQGTALRQIYDLVLQSIHESGFNQAPVRALPAVRPGNPLPAPRPQPVFRGGQAGNSERLRRAVEVGRKLNDHKLEWY